MEPWLHLRVVRVRHSVAGPGGRRRDGRVRIAVAPPCPEREPFLFR